MKDNSYFLFSEMSNHLSTIASFTAGLWILLAGVLTILTILAVKK